MAPSTRWVIRQEPYDPDARDADGDGIVQEQTPWERPAGTRLVDELGRAITRGSNATNRPRGLRVVDRDGNTVNYTPTYERPGQGFEAGGTTPLSDRGVVSLRELGLPTVRDRAAGRRSNQQAENRAATQARQAATPETSPDLAVQSEAPESEKPKQLVTYYHGTGSGNAEVIEREGLKPNLPGVGDGLGYLLNEDRTGVYLTANLDEALEYGQEVFAVLVDESELDTDPEMFHSISKNPIPVERVRKVVDVDLERRRLARERQELGRRDLPDDWTPPTVEDMGKATPLETFAPEGVLYRFERSDREDSGSPYVHYFSPDPQYASQYGDRGEVTTDLPGQYLDVRESKDRKKIKSAIESVLKSLDGMAEKADPDNASKYRRARRDVEKALERDDSAEATGQQLATLTLAANSLFNPEQPFRPGTGQRLVMDELKQQAIIDIESDGSFSMAFRRKPSTAPYRKPASEDVDLAIQAGVTSETIDRPDLVEPTRPRRPFKPSPPPLSGRAQELADEADGDFGKFMELLDEEGYVVFDYETTGLQDGNIPVQIGAVRIKDGKIVERFNVFTNPRRALSDWSKENLKDADGNPLTDEWLAGQTDLGEAHRQLAEFMGDSIIVAHNLPYDGEIIDRMMKEHGIDHNPSGSIDTLMLLRSAVPKGDGESGPERHTLGSLAEFFDVDLGDAAHTADADSEAAAQVLQKAMGWAKDNESDPDIFDAKKQKELFDAATKKFEAQQEQYDKDMVQYKKDLADYERAVAKADEPEVNEPEPEAPLKTNRIPASFSSRMGEKSFAYGDMEWEVFDDFDPSDSADAAYSTWSAYDGNFQMRHVSAALMGEETPLAYGDEVGNPEVHQIIQTGEWDQPQWAQDSAKEVILQTTHLMDAVDNGQSTERPAYRGLSDVPRDSEILSYQPGDTFTMPLSAFTPDRSLAEQFAKQSLGGPRGRSVILVIQPGARVYKAPEGYEEQFEENGEWVTDSVEYVTNGDFEVVRVGMNSSGQTTIFLRHLRTYNSRGSTYSVKADKPKNKLKIPTWVWTTIGKPLNPDGATAPRRPTSKIKKVSVESKSARKWPLKQEPYDPDARDGDNDGIVQEGTPWERPAGTRFLRPNGKEIAAGSVSVDRPRAARLVDASGKDVDYTPTYDRPGYVGLGRTIGETERTIGSGPKGGQDKPLTERLPKIEYEFPLRQEPYNRSPEPDENGILQAGTIWERPEGTVFIGRNGYELETFERGNVRPDSSFLRDRRTNERVDYVPSYQRPGYDGGAGIERRPLKSGDHPVMEFYTPGEGISPDLLKKRAKSESEWREQIINEFLDELSDKELDNVIENFGVSNREELVETLKAQVLKSIRSQIDNQRRGPIFIAMRPEALTSLLRSKRYKSQFEKAKSRKKKIGGFYNPERRREVEAEQLGIPTYLPDVLRPAYGFLETDQDRDLSLPPTRGSSAETYGRVVIKLKDSVRKRSTMTNGDSADSGLISVPMDGELSDEQILAAGGYGGSALNRAMDEVKKSVGKITGKTYESTVTKTELTEDLTDFNLPQYGEVQVHGGFTIDDIDEVIFALDHQVWNPDKGRYVPEITNPEETRRKIVSALEKAKIKAREIKGGKR